MSRGYGWTTAGLAQPPFPRGGRCGACGAGFASDTAFDAHRFGPGDRRRCRDGQAMASAGLHLVPSGLWAANRSSTFGSATFT